MRLGCAGHGNWVCTHVSAMPPDVDAFVYEADASADQPTLATLAGARRAINRNLNHDLPRGVRVDGTKEALLDLLSPGRKFGDRPICSSAREFLAGAAELFVLHVYTMGRKRYAAEMVQLLDPEGKFGLKNADRVIGQEDSSDNRIKNLDIVLGLEETLLQ